MTPYPPAFILAAERISPASMTPCPPTPTNLNCDFMLATAQISYNAFKSGVKEGGAIVVEPNLVKVSDEDKKRWKIYEIPIISIAKDEVGNVITQSVVALGVAVAMSRCMDENLVREEMLASVPAKVKEANAKAYELGLKYAKELLK